MNTPIELNAGQVADKLAGVDRALPVLMTGTRPVEVVDVYVGKIGTDDDCRPVQGVMLIGRELDADEMSDAMQAAQVMEAVDAYLERGGQLAAMLDWLESSA